jgi:hypothetical protein
MGDVVPIKICIDIASAGSLENGAMRLIGAVVVLRGYPKCLFQAATRYLNGACDSPGAMRVTICWMARIRIMHSDESVRRS